MAKDIVWSALAKKELRDVLNSSRQSDGNNQYGKKLHEQIQDVLHRISLNPFIGQVTELENVRYVMPNRDYSLFYRHSLQRIEVLVLWNNKQTIGKLVLL